MYTFTVEKMSCGGCVARVTRAVQSLDPDAKVDVHLRNRVVHVHTEYEPETIATVITSAGYPARETTQA